MKTLITVDPGRTGAFAIRRSGSVVSYDFTSIQDAKDVLTNLDITVDLHKGLLYCVMEDVSASPQMGSVSAFTFGKNAGQWEGLLSGLGIPLKLVKPQEWQRGIPGTSGKTGSIRKRALKEECQRRYPNKKITLANADAILLNDYIFDSLKFNK